MITSHGKIPPGTKVPGGIFLMADNILHDMVFFGLPEVESCVAKPDIGVMVLTSSRLPRTWIEGCRRVCSNK